MRHAGYKVFLKKERQMQVIVFEGPDGVGKTTQAKLLCQSLLETKVQSKFFSFPGCHPGTLGELVYRIHHSPEELALQRINPASLQILHLAAHIDAIENDIIPAVADRNTVILDRYWWSLWVYGRIFGVHQDILDGMIEIEKMSWKKLAHPLVFFFETDQPYRESVINDNWHEIRSLYQCLAEREAASGTVVTIPAHDDLMETHKTIHRYIMDNMKGWQRYGF